MNNIENFRNLLNQHQQQENTKKSQKEQSDRIKSEENKAILDELGLPQFLQSLIDEKLVQYPGKTTEIHYLQNNSTISLLVTDHDIDRMDSTLFKAFVMKDKNIVIEKYYNHGGFIGKIITPDNMTQLVFDSIINKSSTKNGTGWSHFEYELNG